MNFSLPKDVLYPSTDNITKEVMKPYRNVFDKRKLITIVQEMYDHLMATLPPELNPWSTQSKPYVHFEINPSRLLGGKAGMRVGMLELRALGIISSAGSG